MDDSTKEERPNLCKLLEERLIELGLDAETYGPYVVGSDAEELPDVMELLKASSEEEELEDSVWETFSQDVLKAIEQDETFHQEKKNAKKLEAQKKEQELAEKNKAAIKEAEQQPKQAAPKSSQVDDAQKKALMQRFGYEMPDEEEEEVAGVVTNKQAAAAANVERTQELRSKKTTTKKEEQQKTKEQKQSKVQLKEERRKKAIKGERKR
ncbi:unnamed protein product [Cylindrotheca closterium]|uniref:Coiled-coil domain-containing protein 43 n=1 Tax=Cylindrotheca closterium TaxID=2856 RepID=A0AAD2FNG6_9STRA|nr:unnamed protein product [Cylindrotheca closterium]